MLKKLLLAIVIALPMSAFAQKFGIVNIDEVGAAMPEATAMQNQMAETSKKYEDEFTKLQEALNQQYAEFQNMQNDASVTDTMKELKMQDIQERAQKIEQFRQTATQDLQRQQEQLMAPIQQKLMDAIKSVGAEGGFTFIFPAGVDVYQGADVVDVTPLVRAKLGL